MNSSPNSQLTHNLTNFTDVISNFLGNIRKKDKST